MKINENGLGTDELVNCRFTEFFVNQASFKESV